MKIIRPLTITDSGSFTRASTATYFDVNKVLKTAAVNEPRFGYDTTTGKPLGLIEEAAATNLLIYSEQLDNAAWTKNANVSITANSVAAPDGTTTADTVTVASAGTANGVYQTVSVNPSTAYTFSFFVKLGTLAASDFKFAIYNVTGSAFIANDVVPTQTLTASGFVRVCYNFTVPAGCNSIRCYVFNNTTAVAGTAYIWGAQLEAGVKGTSYIPTPSSSTVTRAADVFTNASFLSNVAENDYADWSATTAYALGQRVKVPSLHKIYEALVTNKTAKVTMTIASPAVITWAGHGMVSGTPVTFTTSGALPTGFTVGTTYYVIATGLTADTFQLSASLGGTAVNTSGTQSGEHTISANATYGKVPQDNPTLWLDCGATNRWEMLDKSVTSQTSNTGSIDTTFNITSRVDSVALLNIDAVKVYLKMVEPIDGVVYTKEISTVSTNGIDDMYEYFFEPIERITDIALTDLPPYASGKLHMSFVADTGGTAKVGGTVIGFTKDIGDTEVGARVGIQDYSIKQRDSFGNYTILERAFNKRANFTIHMESNLVDKVQNMLAAYRSSPIVYIGSGSYGSTIVYGFYKSFEIEIGYSDGLSVCTLEVEGLT